MLTYSFVLTNACPACPSLRALVLNFAGSAVSNVVPSAAPPSRRDVHDDDVVGDLGARDDARDPRQRIWNVFTKLGLPVPSLVILVVADRSTAGLVVPTFLGLVMLVGGIVCFTLVLRSESLAERIGRFAERVGSAAMRLVRRPPGHGLARRRHRLRHRSRSRSGRSGSR